MGYDGGYGYYVVFKDASGMEHLYESHERSYIT